MEQELSAPVPAAKKPRRWLVWVSVLVIVFVGAIAAAVASLNRGPYSFLENFHPRHVEVDYEKMMPKGSKSPAGSLPIPHITMLVFSYSDADAVLKSLHAHLTSAKGFTAQDMNLPPLPKGATIPAEYKNAQMWLFTKTSGKTGSPIADQEGVMYSSGMIASQEEVMYEKGIDAMMSGMKSPDEARKKGCTVLLYHEENWLEKQWSKIKGFLHL